GAVGRDHRRRRSPRDLDRLLARPAVRGSHRGPREGGRRRRAYVAAKHGRRPSSLLPRSGRPQGLRAVRPGRLRHVEGLRRLPRPEISTFEVALREEDQGRLEKYRQWGLANGMHEDELELLTPSDVRRYEPNVRCQGAIWSKTDTAVDYREFTQSVRDDAEAAGAKFLLGSEVASIDVAGDLLEVRLAAPEEERVYIDPRRKISVHVGRGQEAHRTRFLINCAGGNSIDIAHRLGVGREYTDLHFRGEYWEIDPAHHYLSSRNLYTVPRHPELPFLDPHWIVRVDGRREIGPNAVPVSGPYTYRGFFDSPKELSSKLLEVPLRNKLRLLVNPDFVALAAEEGASSVSKRVMAKRAQEFLPSLRVQYLVRPGTAGVRASVVDRSGN